MSTPIQKQSNLGDVERRVAARVNGLGSDVHESQRGFSLTEQSAKLAHQSFYVDIPSGRDLETWRSTPGNGLDWESDVEITFCHRLTKDAQESKREARKFAHKIINRLMAFDADWPQDWRIYSPEFDIELGAGTPWILGTVRINVRHILSLTSAA